MAASAGRINVSLQLLVSTILTPVILMAGSIGECAGSEPGVAVLLAQAVGWTQPKLVYLQPGTRVTEKPPTGWSHLVVKSLPRLASGDRETLPASASKTATLFRTVILADVQPVDSDEKDFVLRQVGIGICVPGDEDHDMVVSGNRLDALGLRFTTVQKLVLDAAEAELAEGRIIARTATFALFRTPTTQLLAGKHRRVDLYYAFCVERPTGRLRVAVWSMLPDSEPRQAPSLLVRLGANPVYHCDIDVRAKRILGTVPFSWSFAMKSLPPGRTLRVPAQLGELIASTTRRPADGDTEELERLLMETLSTAPDAEKVGLRTTAPPR
ncbi:MAG TPA: hypothetical protein VKA15_26140 [Isosphaeraceae bacterium]|nr:hypothetical protein [Isosphaeraceae bacterium]